MGEFEYVKIFHALHRLTTKTRTRARFFLLRFFGDDLAVFHYIDRGAVHARGLARDLGGAPERAADRGGKLFAGLKFGFSFHCDLSNNFGVLPELSYTLQASDKTR